MQGVWQVLEFAYNYLLLPTIALIGAIGVWRQGRDVRSDIGFCPDKIEPSVHYIGKRPPDKIEPSHL